MGTLAVRGTVPRGPRHPALSAIARARRLHRQRVPGSSARPVLRHRTPAPRRAEEAAALPSLRAQEASCVRATGRPLLASPGDPSRSARAGTADMKPPRGHRHRGRPRGRVAPAGRPSCALRTRSPGTTWARCARIWPARCRCWMSGLRTSCWSALRRARRTVNSIFFGSSSTIPPEVGSRPTPTQMRAILACGSAAGFPADWPQGRAPAAPAPASSL